MVTNRTSDPANDQTSDKKRRQPTPDRARKRAIRAHAARTGVAYSGVRMPGPDGEHARIYREIAHRFCAGTT